MTDAGRIRYFTTSDGDKLSEVDEDYFVRRREGNARSLLELDAREMAELQAELDFVRPVLGRDPLAEAAEAATAAVAEPASPEPTDAVVVDETPVAVASVEHVPAALLRSRRQRPRSRRAAEQRDELAADHSITSSARASRDGETIRLRALAALRLITNSNLVGCKTGRSAGFSPFRIRPV